MLGECLRYCSYYCCSTAVSLTVWLYAAYKPSHSMVGKKMESRWEPEPCGPTCYLIQLVSVDTPVCYLFPRINMPSVIPIHQSVYLFSGHFPDGPVVASLPSVVFSGFSDALANAYFLGNNLHANLLTDFLLSQ